VIIGLMLSVIVQCFSTFFGVTKFVAASKNFALPQPPTNLAMFKVCQNPSGYKIRETYLLERQKISRIVKKSFKIVLFVFAGLMSEPNVIQLFGGTQNNFGGTQIEKH
jgi:hypothetical protein